MKKITNYFVAITLVLTTVGFASCSKDDDKKTSNEPTIRDIENVGTHYALYRMHNGSSEAIQAGDTIRYVANEEDINVYDLVELQFKIENKKREALLTSQDLVQLEGSENMSASIDPKSTHGATVCGGGSCPWNGQPYTVAPGMSDYTIGIQIKPSHQTSGDWGLYRLAVGVGENLENATVIYLHVTI